MNLRSGSVQRAAAWALAGACAVALLFPAAAIAWTVDTTVPSCIIVKRTADDTGTDTLYLYQYGGTPTSTQYQNGSYDDTGSGTPFGTTSPLIVPVSADEDSVAFRGVQSYCMVVFGNSRKKCVATYYNVNMPVYFVGQTAGATPTINVASTVTVEGSVIASVSNPTNEATVSVTGTLPVSVAQIGGFDRKGIDAAIAVAIMVAGGATGFLIVRQQRAGGED